MLVGQSTRVAAVTTEFTVNSGGAILSGEESGDGRAVVLLHGLTATRRYVVMGSRSLEREGHRVVMYDARGHGRSSSAPSRDAYAYSDLADDLIAVLDDRGIDRAVLAGASMGAHTLLRVALLAPERVSGLVVITPAYSGPDAMRPERIERWDALAAGLRSGGVEGFVEAYGEPRVGSERLARTVLTVIRQRLSEHEHPDALADALQAVPRSMPFGEVDELAAISVPVAVVASNDDADPEHPVAIGESYAAAIPGARLITDSPGSSPVAWQGSQLSKIIATVAEQAS